jgi:DNA repair photolyase
MLGKPYYPRGRAMETAQQVLEKRNPMALNVALGCPNRCGYCFGRIAFFKPDWTNMRLPEQNPLDIVKKQKFNPEGVFLSFATDPFVKENRKNTLDLLTFFRERNILTATLSKVDVPDIKGNRNGMTIVSLDPKFNLAWEPKAPLSSERIRKLKARHYEGEYTWISMEPFPPPEIWEQDLIELLEEIKFVDFIIFGKWNYDNRASTKEAISFYREKAIEFRDFCEAYKIRYWIKGSDSQGFIAKNKIPQKIKKRRSYGSFRKII